MKERLMWNVNRFFIFIFVLCFKNFCFSNSVFKAESPDKNIMVNISIQEKLEPFPTGEMLYYSIFHHGKQIILDSPIGLEFKDHAPLAKNLVIKNTSEKLVKENWQRVWGKNKLVLNHYHELQLQIEEKDLPHRQVELIFRVYNDGVAFRYYLPEQAGLFEFNLTSERTHFRFPGNSTIWATNFGGFISHQESEFRQMKINDITASDIIGCPLLINVTGESWIAVTEADLTDWAGIYFSHTGNIPNTLVSNLSPRLDDPEILVKSKTPCYSPWRVFIMAESAVKLIESNIISNLNDPCEIKDTSWITPGKSAWDRWWCGSFAPDADFEVGVNTETFKYFTDFAAEMNWEYVLVDWFWYGPPFDPGKPLGSAGNQAVDITQPKSDVNIKEIILHAKKKNVKVLLWLDWFHADWQMDEAFPLYEKWGVAGIKVDFMQRDDQEMVNFYHRLVKKAAEHHLIVDFHGAYKPTGWSRTYPNVITREGVLGNEYNKWSDRVTPDHNLTIPFTRGLLGEMDFTPGGYLHTNKQTFKIIGSDEPAPRVMGTRCHQLAMLIVYESALQVLCDSPYNYRGQSGLEFLRQVPTTWDETRGINGNVGDFITIARRSGQEWYLGSMTDWEERTFEISLNFLGNGKYQATIYQDAPLANDFPDRLVKTTVIVTRGDKISLKLASGGGQVVHFVPLKQ
jgi:alpha-glucosidase